ncbi:hypothetical protein [Cohnella rhizosphaerae]|uniref:Uncharacterized protein n=1 Tax=Cohnella rhizosphaerae TaxID=1457232 RepID=A0A9X4L0J4_9BACL|nr:hypothetical protein [Cohnella rhizosphaerae]MDG0811239.1 hypothetical protein [Cohnella rhizosphaerae]
MARSQSLLHLVNGNLGAMDNPDGLPVYPRYVAVLVKNVGDAVVSFQTLLSERRPAIPHDLVLVGEREAVVLFYPEAADAAPALSVREEMRRLMPFYARAGKLVVGIGGVALSPESVHESRANAEYACQYGFEAGYPAVILYDEIMHRKAVHLPFPYEPFSNAVLAGDSSLAERMIGGYIAELAGGGMSIESVEVNLMQAVTSMSGLMIDHHLQHLVPGGRLVGRGPQNDAGGNGRLARGDGPANGDALRAAGVERPLAAGTRFEGVHGRASGRGHLAGLACGTGQLNAELRLHAV